MYHAKQDGRNTCRFFKQDMVVRAAEWQFIETGQGYYLKRPMPAEEFRALLEAGTSASCD